MMMTAATQDEPAPVPEFGVVFTGYLWIVVRLKHATIRPTRPTRHCAQNLADALNRAYGIN